MIERRSKLIVYVLTRNINDTISSVVSTLKHKEQAKQEITELEKEDRKLKCKFDYKILEMEVK